ncbi:MAG: hypothetical protein DRG11_05930 [Epsilonproteobacteria bacterium]|nr:MAG: hypothetical protein DRG11_05930 [Campylobacterota bacterium]
MNIIKSVVVLVFATNILSAVVIKPFQANFSQVVTNTQGKKLRYSGQIYTNKDKNILWQYKIPTIKNIYVSINQVIIEEPLLEQAIYTAIEGGLSINGILSSAKKIGANRYKSTLQGTTYFVKIQKNKILNINYNDKFGNKVYIGFHDIKTDPKYKRGLFVFRAKSSYDIIRK